MNSDGQTDEYIGAYDRTSGMQDSWVVYADILGFRSRIESAVSNGREDELVQELRDSLSEAVKALSNQGRPTFDNRRDFEVRIFTDNFLIAFPARDPARSRGEPEFGQVLDTIGQLQLALASKGYFLRGGLAWGPFYADDEIAVGPALLDAYDLDRSGGPPVIVLTPSAVEVVREQFGFYRNHREWAPQYQDLLEFGDDATVFVNYLAQTHFAFPEGGVFLNELDEHRVAIQAAYAGADSDSIRSKYAWLSAYHNFVCLDFAKAHPPIYDCGYDPEIAAAHAEAQRMLDFMVEAGPAATAPQIRRVSHEPIRNLSE